MIKNIAIIGAGAVGAYFIEGFISKPELNVYIVAEGARKQRLIDDGIVINGNKRTLKVIDYQEGFPMDLVIVSVKYNALTEVADKLSALVGDDTIVMSPMNGIDSEEIIGERIGANHMIYSMIKIASERKNNEIRYNPDITKGVFYGPVAGDNQKLMVSKLDELFLNTPINTNVCDDIVTQIWYKYTLNICRNLPQAMIGVDYGAYTDSEYVAKLSNLLCDEVIAVAKACGIDICDRDNAMGNNVTVNPRSKFSTLQDLEAGRHTEIEMFSGTLIRLGKKLSVPTPYNEVVYLAIKALEEKNDGVI